MPGMPGWLGSCSPRRRFIRSTCYKSIYQKNRIKNSNVFIWTYPTFPKQPILSHKMTLGTVPHTPLQSHARKKKPVRRTEVGRTGGSSF